MPVLFLSAASGRDGPEKRRLVGIGGCTGGGAKGSIHAHGASRLALPNPAALCENWTSPKRSPCRSRLLNLSTRWKASTLTERAAAQSHFIDLCEVLDQPHPAAADQTGESLHL